MILWQEWWVWIVIGVTLAVAEVMLPGFILLGFAIGAALVGLLLLIGALGNNLFVLILIFAIASLISWIALRRLMGVRKGQVKIWDRDINDN
jgi:membrane protein implicated in regulation of membrane protease activity